MNVWMSETGRDKTKTSENINIILSFDDIKIKQRSTRCIILTNDLNPLERVGLNDKMFEPVSNHERKPPSRLYDGSENG